ncbi:hypothetical protein Gohar_013731 [Gossypium harknessii]|uniref:Uncharacterized protein n=1 Tax=Gossypium harknessii TaxID=34285 RepID=A0A7J9H123_9ROSI|nr:hypothetical protein [Gossypium harknessii]
MISQSCNSLNLCISWKRFFICNPTTKKFKWLFLPSPECKDRRLLGISIALDPLKSTHHKGVIYWDSYLLESIWFDVENQWLKTMQMPIVGDAGYRYFGESRGY